MLGYGLILYPVDLAFPRYLIKVFLQSGETHSNVIFKLSDFGNLTAQLPDLLVQLVDYFCDRLSLGFLVTHHPQLRLVKSFGTITSFLHCCCKHLNSRTVQQLTKIRKRYGPPLLVLQSATDHRNIFKSEFQRITIAVKDLLQLKFYVVTLAWYSQFFCRFLRG